MNWRVYYTDESTFDDSMGTPADAPTFGVVCIVYPDEVVGRVVMNGWDWYYYVPSEKQWWGSDIHGLLDRLLHGQEVEALKQGRNVSNAQFGIIMRRAANDPDFPIKSATRDNESP